MGEFFKGWRRKAGCILLLIALAFGGVWNLNDVSGYSSLEALKLFRGGRVAWAVPEEKAEYAVGFGADGIWFGKFRTDVVGMTGIFVISISYWQAITVLTLLSVWLILGKRPEPRAEPDPPDLNSLS